MVVMIVVACVAGLVCGVALIWYVATRGSHAAEVSESEFDDEYDRLVARGEAPEGTRGEAWRDFETWQTDNERERLRWEEAGEE